MKVLIDGNEVEAETIEILHENQIIGCHCNGGVHTEVLGDYRITLDEDSITLDVGNEEEEQSCTLNIDDLLSEMEKTTIVMRNKDQIIHLYNMFHKI